MYIIVNKRTKTEEIFILGEIPSHRWKSIFAANCDNFMVSLHLCWQLFQICLCE